MSEHDAQPGARSAEPETERLIMPLHHSIKKVSACKKKVQLIQKRGVPGSSLVVAPAGPRALSQSLRPALYRDPRPEEAVAGCMDGRHSLGSPR